MSEKGHTPHPSDSSGPAESGTLSGCRVSIQPALSVRGWPAEAGSRALEGYVALEDAFVVQRLREEGAHLTASGQMGELGFGLAGDATGRALPTGCQAGLVTDAFGESRIIASKHRLIGFKPSQGTVSRRGMIGLIPSMETLAVVTGAISTLHSLLRVMIAPDEQDFSLEPGALPNFTEPFPLSRSMTTVGVLKDLADSLDQSEQHSFYRHVDWLTHQGLTVKDLSWPEGGQARTVHHIIGSVEASSSAGRFDGVRYGYRAKGTSNWNEMYLQSRAESFQTLLKSYLFQGAYLQFKDFEAYQAACRLRRRLVRESAAWFAQAQVLALPVRRKGVDPSKAETVDEVYDGFEMTLLANLLGFPALSVPVPQASAGFDPGLQLIAPRLQDRELAELAATLLE